MAAQLLTITPDDLHDAPRPVRIGIDLAPDDQVTALAVMAPPALAAHQARAWLAGHVFVVTRTGRLDRCMKRPVAQLALAAG